MSEIDLHHIRKEYRDKPLRRKDLFEQPIEQLLQWLREALEAKITEPNAMILATASREGKPSSRTILLKRCNEKGLVFFTNYHSLKAKNMDENPFASGTFYWGELERQATIYGNVERISLDESESYFHTRPRGAQLGAWVSKQGKKVHSREKLDEEYQESALRFESQNIPLPAHWGGYRMTPLYVEFWQGRKNRLHDRFSYTLKEGKWEIHRLYP